MPSLDEFNQISHKFKIFEILFGGRDWGATSVNVARTKHVPKHSIRHHVEDDFEDATGDALKDCAHVGRKRHTGSPARSASAHASFFHLVTTYDTMRYASAGPANVDVDGDHLIVMHVTPPN
jgi:hypothetical protein